MAFQKIVTGSFVIGNSQTNAIQLNEGTLAGITTGSNLTSGTLTFLVSDDGTNFFPLYNESTEYSITTGSATNPVAKCISFPIAVWWPWNFVKARLGNSASPVNQVTANSLIDFNFKIL
jgi:hypothetical protein